MVVHVMTEKSFVRKKVKSLTLGEKLQQLREDHQLRIFDLSRKINVKDTYIIALEKGDYDNLPTKVYAKGFVRSYARFFGVPEDVLLNLFDREYSIYKNISDKDEEETVNRLPKVPRFVFTPRVIFGFLGLIILLSVGIYLYFGVDNFVSSPWLVIENPINNSVIESDAITVQGKTRSNSRVFINGQQIFVDIDGYFSHDVGLSSGVNVINVTSINKFDKETQQEIVVDARYEIAKKTEEAQEKKEINVFVKPQKKPVWIDVSVDGVGVYNDTMQLDEEKEFNAAERVEITTSSGIDTLVSYDGEDYFSISEDDDIVRNWSYEGSEEESDSDEDQGEE